MNDLIDSKTTGNIYLGRKISLLVFFIVQSVAGYTENLGLSYYLKS